MEPVVVSAYYKIPSKQSHEFYIQHLKRFFSSIPLKIIFFTEKRFVKEFSYYRGNLPIKFITNHDIFEKFDRSFWEHQCSIDPEKYHTPELAAVWYNKKEFILKAIEDENVPYIWCDSGGVREDIDFTNFGKRILISKDSHLLTAFCNIPKEQFFRYPFVGIIGGFQAGYPETWRKISKLYDDTVLEYSTNQVSCNSDQYILASLTVKFPELFKIIYVNDWFDFLKIL